MKKLLAMLILTLMAFSAMAKEQYTNRAIVITQDCALDDNAVIFLVCVFKNTEPVKVNRYCKVHKDEHSFVFSYNANGEKYNVHVPMNVIDIGDEKANKKAETMYNMYRPMIFDVGFETVEEEIYYAN